MDTAAIAGQAMNMATARLQQEVATSVLKMGLDSAKQQAQAITDVMKVSTQAMERSVNPHLGARLDVLG